MEDTIRKALQSGLTVTDFEAIITYPDTETQIPSHYSFTYTINGTVTIAEAKAAGVSMPVYSSHWLYKYMIDRDGDGM